MLVLAVPTLRLLRFAHPRRSHLAPGALPRPDNHFRLPPARAESAIPGFAIDDVAAQGKLSCNPVRTVLFQEGPGPVQSVTGTGPSFRSPNPPGRLTPGTG